MTDRELLEFAAKAFGCVSYVDGMGWIHEDELGARGAWWNPLDNDGDAFRLAVRVGLCMFLGKIDPLDVWSICVSSAECGDELSVGTIEGHDEMEVSRRAITRAAAEIGRRMP